MTGGVLSYWLCPRDYACEDCPLDRVFSGRQQVMVDQPSGLAADDVLHSIRSGALDRLRVPLRRRRDLHYHTTHVWGRQIAPGRIRLGLDDVTARLAEDSESWSLPRPGTHVSGGDCLGSTRADGMPIRVTSPMAGRVAARNVELQTHPTLVTWSPYDAGWLVELLTDAPLSPQTGFMVDETVVAGWFEAELERLARCQTRLAEAQVSRLGPTLQDGGIPLASLREALGREGYRAAVRMFFPLSDTEMRP